MDSIRTKCYIGKGTGIKPKRFTCYRGDRVGYTDECMKSYDEYRQVALDLLKSYEDTGLSPEEIVRLNNFEQTQCAKLLSQMPKWVPVSERLPTREEYIKNDGRFIVSDGNRVEEGLFDIYADGYNDPHWPYQSCQPVKWMPMPDR